mgnify:CR=1 FL=1
MLFVAHNNLPFQKKQFLIFNSLLWTMRLIRYLPFGYALLLTIQIVFSIRLKRIDCIYAHYPNSAFLIAAFFISTTAVCEVPKFTKMDANTEKDKAKK